MFTNEIITILSKSTHVIFGIAMGLKHRKITSTMVKNVVMRPALYAFV